MSQTQRHTCPDCNKKAFPTETTKKTVTFSCTCGRVFVKTKEQILKNRAKYNKYPMTKKEHAIARYKELLETSGLTKAEMKAMVVKECKIGMSTLCKLISQKGLINKRLQKNKPKRERKLERMIPLYQHQVIVVGLKEQIKLLEKQVEYLRDKYENNKYK